MNRLAFYLSLFAAALIAESARAASINVNATLTVDNHYGLYSGRGTSLRFHGRNEMGAGGAPGLYNWSLPETFGFNITEGDYLYVVAWSDDDVAQGFIGQFSLSDGRTIYTDTQSWEVALGTLNLNDNDNIPAFSTLDNLAYGAVHYSLPHGSQPWGYVPGISNNASWIWGAQLTPGSGTGEYMVFRTRVSGIPSSTVPEPASCLLLAGALPLIRRARGKKLESK